jgi:hypothetical protein
MAYRSQLVIRTSEPQGANVLERVKQLADSESKTISEKAIELLAMGLDVVSGTSAAPVQTEPAVLEPVEESAERSESAVRRDPAPALASVSVKEKDPKIRPDEAPGDAAARCVELFGDEGASAAAQGLTGFFAVAEPVDGANIREELQERLSKGDYDALMDELKQTEEYREYRRRVVYASW